MARGKKAKTDNPGEGTETIPVSIFEALEQNSPGGGDDPEPKKSEVDVDALMKQIAQLSERVERAERTNAALLAQPAPQPVYAPAHNPQPYAPAYTQPAPQGLSFEGLPDPVTDPKAYGEALAARIAQQNIEAMRAAQASQQQQQASESRVEALWERFEEQYPDLAGDETLVEVAATKVVKEMAKRGVDVQKYMFLTSDQFLSDVADRMKKDFGKLFDKDDEPAPQAPDRTAGIFGGTEGVPKPAAAAVGKPGDFVKDLQDLQKRDGYL